MQPEEKKYDIGIVGYWWSTNYGSVATYYALYKIITDMGFNAILIDRPESALSGEGLNVFSRDFMKEYALVSNSVKWTEYAKLNELCDTFIVGSDQVWTSTAIRGYNYFFFLDFADNEKNKIAYASSFGECFKVGENEKRISSNCLKRFSSISVREYQAVDICEKELDVKAEWVMDPVFLLDTEQWNKISDKAPRKTKDILGSNQKYLLAYILNPSDEKREIIHEASNFLNLPIICILDGRKGSFDENNAILHVDNTISNVVEEEWLFFLMNAEYIVTDSQHGSAMAIKFNKQFLCCSNKKWGQSRFDSLFGLLDLKERQCRTRKEIAAKDIYNKKINYERVNEILSLRVKNSHEWLVNSINIFRSVAVSVSQYLCNGCGICEKKCVVGAVMLKPDEHGKLKRSVDKTKCTNCGLCSECCPEINTLESNAGSSLLKKAALPDNNAVGIKSKAELLHENEDFMKIRILATLLRDYNIKHIVISPGGRDVPLVRMFEYNQDSFILHSVTDERSASYYGLGLAAQLHQPVACVCTSGTAASNYLPAVTEAYYTCIPLIMITADRRQIYLDQGEDQTIPQKHIYDSVIKKSITVPEGSGNHAMYQTRRDITDCILEATHNGNGPVHINISIENIKIGSDVPKEHWSLLPRISPHILRICSDDDYSEQMRWVKSLKNSKRILVVYGQNNIPSEKQLEDIKSFASKYNCVFVTDHISNLDCEYAIKPFNMLRALSQKEFNDKLSPDILISVGGKRLMNDPLTFKIRSGLSNIRHWSVVQNGKIKDYYFKLTSVLEMSQDYFFHWFSENAGDAVNDLKYLKVWKEMVDSYILPENDKYDSVFVQSHFLPAIPSGSLLHLGVGQSFFECRRFHLQKNVSVFCNMGTNGIDGCTSTFMGQCAAIKDDRLCFLLVGDLSFFYDMNSIWNKPLKKNIRILMVNNNGTSLLRGHNLKNIASVHNTEAKGWVEATGFDYICAHSKEEYVEKINYFLSDKPQNALFFEVFCN